MQFDHQTVELPKIKQKNKALPDGGRAYETPEGKLYPSITTVLSIRNKKQLYEWRKRVGEDVANHIATTAAETTRGHGADWFRDLTKRIIRVLL